jgi:hypothetical protein
MFPTPYSDDGVELILIRWLLSMTPAKRLETAQPYADFVVKMHGLNSQSSLAWDAEQFDEVFDLETLIAIKEEIGGQKDQAMLLILRERSMNRSGAESDYA